MPLQPHELGWIAGVIDMKGVITKKNNQKRATPQIAMVVDSRHLDIIARLSRYTGTDPTGQQRTPKKEWSRRNCVEHCPYQHVHVQEVTFPEMARWQVSGSSLVVIMYNVMPYMTDSAKALTFREAMESVASTLPLEGQGRGAIDKAIARLERLGWNIPFYIRRKEEQETQVNVD